MPQAGMKWRHVTITTRGSWLPGDSRGWRSRDHRIHSDGDYRKPPPTAEHAGLRRFSEGRQSAKAAVIPQDLRAIVGQAFVDYFADERLKLLAVAISAQHGHMLLELPDEIPLIRETVGEAKRLASRAVREQMPGRIWAAGCGYDLVSDSQHQRNVYRYILHRQGDAAWTWCFRRGVLHDPGSEGA